VADCAAHRNSSVDILPRGFVIVALKAFGRINVGRESHWMLPKVGAGRRKQSQHDRCNQECGAKNEAVGRKRERHGSPFPESEDSAYLGEGRRMKV
jgi:hypothetical protein